MSSELFERYRDALRIGHVPVARGDLDAAAWAYREAIALVPDLPVAHVGLGAIHLRTGDLPAALAEYDAALARAPRDEAALTGRAETLARMRRRVDAAETLDHLSAMHEAAGRLPEALAAATGAVALAEGAARRRQIERLNARRAARLAGVDADLEGERADVGDDAVTEALDHAGEDAPEQAFEPEPPPEPLPPPAPKVDGLERMSVAEDALDRGDREVARLAALMAADAFRVDGRPSAAIDACAFALTIAPDDAAVHLELVTLYLERGWRTRAEEKLVLLGRLADLDGELDRTAGGDTATRIQLCSVAAMEFPDNAELARLCGAA